MQDYKPLSLQNVLSRALSFVNRDWVKQYLFKSTPEADLSILTSNHQVQHAFAGKLHTSTNGPPTGFSPFMLANMNANILFIPAYSIDEVSAGILLKENRFGIKPPNLADSLFHRNTVYGRFVRNEDTGDLFMAAMDDSNDYIDVMFITWDTDQQRHRCFMRFEKQKMLDSLFSAGPINPACLGESVSFFIHVNEHRECLKCNPFGVGVCVCRKRLPLARPRHVLDFTTSTNNMKTLTGGSFSGIGVHTVFNSAAAPFAPISVYGEMTAADEPGLIPRLLSWSISTRISSSVLSPSWFPSFPKPAVCSASISGAEPFPTDPFDAEFLDVPDDAENAVIPEVQSTSATYGESNVGNGDLRSLTSRISSPAISAEGSLLRDGLNPDMLLPPSVPETRIEPGEFAMPVRTVPESGLLPPPPVVAPNATLPLVNPLLRSGTELQSQPCILPRAELPSYGAGSALNVSIGLNVNQINLGPAVPTFSTARNDREAKALQRKLRNRESAARSNLRKQMLGKELKEKITKEMRKMETLQCRLKSLQEENRRLRNKIAGNPD